MALAMRPGMRLCCSQLRRLRPDWRLVMSSLVSPGFLSLLLGDEHIEQRPCRWDVGMVQADALGSDPSATLIALAELDARLPEQVQAEASWIRAQGRPVLILGTFPPLQQSWLQPLMPLWCG